MASTKSLPIGGTRRAKPPEKLHIQDTRMQGSREGDFVYLSVPSISLLQESKGITIKAVNSPIFFGFAQGNVFNFEPPNADMQDQVNLRDTTGSKVVQPSPSTATCKCKQLKTEDTGRDGYSKIMTFGCQEKPFGRVDDIAAVSTNEIVVLDRWHEKLITILQADKHTILSQELQLELTNPSHVSVWTDDLVVLDSPEVKIFKKGYDICLKRFHPGRDLQGSPTCLAVGANRIAVGYQDKQMISVHDFDGRLINWLSAPKIGEQMRVHKEQLVYIDKDRRRLLALDIDGNSIFSSDIRSSDFNSQAYGLCHDSEGSIYVGVHAGRLREGEILRFNPDGTDAGCLRRVSGYPVGIAFTPAGHLALAAETVVKIYPSGSPILRQNAFYHG